MPVYPFDPSTFHWNAPHPHPGGSFRPTGRLEQHGPLHNPNLWEADETIAARLIVGFSVGDVPTWTMDDLIPLVQRIRERQAGDPSASFVAQKGIYKHRDASKGVVHEDGAQIFIVNTSGASLAAFRKEMVELAEEICVALQQEAVIVEIQVNGVSHKTMGVGP